MAKKYLILGTGIAGLSAARAIREQDAAGEIVMVGREKESPYLRPLLSKTDLRTFRREGLPVEPEVWYAENRIQVLRGTAVSAIDPAKHTVTLENGTALSYDKCIYALGADCNVPPIPGREKKGVVTLRTSADLHKLRRLCMTANSAVLIGGGVIGLEMAWQLHEMGIECIILEAAPRLMPRQLDKESARYLQERIAACGISCYTGVEIVSLSGGERVSGVCLSGGRQFPTDIVIMSTGIRPAVAIAREAGLQCDRGVLTDEQLVTGDPDILAAGDCLQCGVPNPGLWGFAQASGKLAGYNAVHPEAPLTFRAEAMPVILSAMGMGLFAAGDTSGGEGITAEGSLLSGDPGDPCFRVNRNDTGEQTYRKTFYRDGKLCGVVLIGDIREMGRWMTERKGGGRNDESLENH